MRFAKWYLVATHSMRGDVGLILQLLKNENGWEYLCFAHLSLIYQHKSNNNYNIYRMYIP